MKIKHTKELLNCSSDNLVSNKGLLTIHHKSLICAALLSMSIMTASYTNAEDLNTEDIYTQAPSPQELADKLYQPRYRSIVINNQTVQQKDENLFAMLINFEFDSTKILPQSYPLLDSVGQMLNLESVAEQKIIIEGHTDAIGSEQYNLSLSHKRAQAIREYLSENYGVAAERMKSIGKGEAELYNSGQPQDKINRRVQFRPYS